MTIFTHRHGILLSALLLGAFAAGCRDNIWWEYRDDPYLAAVAHEGDAEMLRNINSVYQDNRQIALRLAAQQAAKMRRSGAISEAERLENIIIRRYGVEKEQQVKLCIIRICAPACGPGSTLMVQFLRARLAAGEFPGHAALALVELHPKGVVNDIIPLTRHPAPEVRYQAAVALSVLGDPKGYPEVVRVWQSMGSPSWPPMVDGVTIDEAKIALEQRAERGFGQRIR